MSDEEFSREVTFNTGADTSQPLAKCIGQALNRGDYGYHEMTDAEAIQVTAVVHQWLLDRAGIDLFDLPLSSVGVGHGN